MKTRALKLCPCCKRLLEIKVTEHSIDLSLEGQCEGDKKGGDGQI